MVFSLLTSACGTPTEARTSVPAQTPDAPVAQLTDVDVSEIAVSVSNDANTSIACANAVSLEFGTLPIQTTANTTELTPARTTMLPNEQAKIVVDTKQVLQMYEDLKSKYSLDQVTRFLVWHEYFHACKNNKIYPLKYSITFPNGAVMSSIKGAAFNMSSSAGNQMISEIEEGLGTIYAQQKAGIPTSDILMYPRMTKLLLLMQDAKYINVDEMANLLHSKDPNDIEKFWGNLFGKHAINEADANGKYYVADFITNIMIMLYGGNQAFTPEQTFENIKGLYNDGGFSQRNVMPGSIIVSEQ
jgi:hypothetical protein